MTDDPFTGPEWDDFVKHCKEELLPKLDDSAMGMCLVPSGPTDVKFAVELGFLIMMDKPILAVVDPGVAVPPKLRAVADAIIIGRPSDPGFQEKFVRAVDKMMPGITTRKGMKE